MESSVTESSDDPQVDAGLSGVEQEDTGADDITEPFDPAQIRIDTKPMTVDLLVKRIKANEIDLAPAFQRAAGLWGSKAQSQLIESLLVRIPIPAFYMDATNEEKWLVVDGLQRLTVLRRFIVEQVLPLEQLEFLKNFDGMKFDQLPRPMQRRIEETQVIVYLIQPGTPEEVKFNIFKRINTGGLPLSAQEIRHALNQGPAAQMLEDLAKTEEFQTATDWGIRDQRMTDRECVLRFLAFVTVPYSQYKSQDLDGFLHAQMRALNKETEAHRVDLERRFVRAMQAASGIFGNDAFRKRYRKADGRKPINKALFEAWSVNLDALSDQQLDMLKQRKGALTQAFIKLMNEDVNFDRAVTQGTGDVSKVRLRFEKIREIIQEVLA